MRSCESFIYVCWKGLQGKNPEGKNFRKLLRRKQSSAKISKISRNTLKSSKSDIFYLLRNLLKYLLRTFFSSAKFSEVFALCVFTLWLFPSLGRAQGGGKTVGGGTLARMTPWKPFLETLRKLLFRFCPPPRSAFLPPPPFFCRSLVPCSAQICQIKFPGGPNLTLTLTLNSN